jgi:lipid-binding SYLF domain-containing protein
MIQSTRFARQLLAAALALSFAAGAAHAGPREDERAQNAVRVLTEVQEIPENAIPDKLLDEAHAVVIVPDTIKAGLVIGGRRGRGVMAVKSPDGTWSQPAFVSLTGGSIGFQAGVQSADVVLVFRNQRSLDSIVNGKITLGADAGVAAGPMGRNAATATDGQLRAEIWSWSRARGLFAGIALDGAVLSIDDAANQAVYGAGTTPRMIFERRTTGQPSSAVVDFRDRLEEATAIARANRGTDGRQVAGAARSGPALPPPLPEQGAPNEGGAQSQGLGQPRNEPIPSSFEPVDDGEIRAEPLGDPR